MSHRHFGGFRPIRQLTSARISNREDLFVFSQLTHMYTRKNKKLVERERSSIQRYALIHFDLRTTKSSNDTPWDSRMPRSDRRQDRISKVARIRDRHSVTLPDCRSDGWALNRTAGTVRMLESTYNREVCQSKDSRIHWMVVHTVTDGLVVCACEVVASVGGNADDGTDPVRSRPLPVRECAKLNRTVSTVQLPLANRDDSQWPFPLVPRPALTKQSFNDRLCRTLFFHDLFTSAAKYRYLEEGHCRCSI